MKKFEYKKVKADTFPLEECLLNLHGENGWELVCFKAYITTNYAYFKREIFDFKHQEELEDLCYSGTNL